MRLTGAKYMTDGKPHEGFEAAMTHKEVAAEMTRRGHPMSRARVAQLERRAICKIREALRIDPREDIIEFPG